MPSIIHNDPRTGNLYEVDHNTEFEMTACRCYVDGRIIPDPIKYDRFEDIPITPRIEIGKKLQKRARRRLL
jgi:hypothetical protein